MSDYLNSRAIGSSLLADVVEGTYKDENGIDCPSLCFDRATIPKKPTAAMEVGKMFEDLIEETYSNKKPFSEKYFKSDIGNFPEYGGKNPDIKQIFEILDSEDITSEIEKAYEQLKKYFTKDDGSLYSAQKNRKRCLDQIKGHDYRRPVPAPLWDKLQIMLERFGAYPFQIGESEKIPLFYWLHDSTIEVKFQIEFFWKHESGAECRAKFDMVLIFEYDGKQCAICFDLKATENWQSSLGFWRNKYIWQSLHYNEGFKSWCAENDLIPADRIWYLIQESAEPQITHARILSDREYTALNLAYNEAIEKTWEWIEAGKPVAGFIEQETVDRYGRPE
jgi:hypothetical protein